LFLMPTHKILYFWRHLWFQPTEIAVETEHWRSFSTHQSSPWSRRQMRICIRDSWHDRSAEVGIYQLMLTASVLGCKW